MMPWRFPWWTSGSELLMEGALGSICGQGTKIRQATQDGKKKRRLRRPTDRRKLRQDPSSNRPAVKEKSDTIGEILNMARILKLLGVYCEFS